MKALLTRSLDDNRKTAEQWLQINRRILIALLVNDVETLIFWRPLIVVLRFNCNFKRLVFLWRCNHELRLLWKNWISPSEIWLPIDGEGGTSHDSAVVVLKCSSTSSVTCFSVESHSKATAFNWRARLSRKRR